MHQRAVIEKEPERVLLQRAEIADHGDENAGHALLVQGTREMVMIGDVMMFVGSKDDGNHMLAEKRGAALRVALFPLFLLGSDLAHSDRYLRRSEFRDRNGVQEGSRAIGMFTSPRLCFARMGGARQP